MAEIVQRNSRRSELISTSKHAATCIVQCTSNLRPRTLVV
jgi:hypothetical protein